MKKLLLFFSAVVACGSVAMAQQRMTLYEEFSGENCPPCAEVNPILWSLLSGNGNLNKVIMIKYPTPIPSAGPIYNLYPNDCDNRMPYYNIGSAPSARHDGKIYGNGHAGNITQALIDAEYALPSPFNMTVTHAWNATGDSITINVNVTCVAAFAPANAQLRLRTALVEHLIYDEPPGTTKEREFHNEIRRMYPDGNGTAMTGAWTMGQTQSFTLKGYVPPYIDKVHEDTRVVAWIQNDNDKNVAQAAQSVAATMPVDVGSIGFTSTRLLCTPGGTANFTPSITIKNTGATPLTSATVYFKVDNGTWQSQNWTGSLAPHATTVVNFPSTGLTAGDHMVYDSVSNPNNQTDLNIANNFDRLGLQVANTTPNALPIATGFENGGTLPVNWLFYDLDGNYLSWQLVNGTGLLHNASTYGLRHPNYSYGAGESNVAILPTPNMPAGSKALDFYVAYAQYQNENDKLEVVYSTDCGVSWTSVWNSQGAALATAPATTNQFVPSQAQWKLKSIDVSTVPSAAMLAFRATSDYGNHLYIDDVNLRTGPVTGLEEVVASGYVQLYPNPAKDLVTIEFTLNERAGVQVQILDATGRVVNNVLSETMNAGLQKIKVSTSSLAQGLYNVKIQTEKGSRIERLSVIK